MGHIYRLAKLVTFYSVCRTINNVFKGGENKNTIYQNCLADGINFSYGRDTSCTVRLLRDIRLRTSFPSPEPLVRK